MTNLHLITETCQNVALSEEKDRLSQLLTTRASYAQV